MSKQLVNIGVIRKPHGVRGFLYITSLTDFSDYRFQPEAEVMVLHKNQAAEEFVIEESQPYKQGYLIRFEGITSLDEALGFRGCYICIPEEHRLDLEEDEFYLDELEGMDVFGESGNKIGIVKKVEEMPAQPVLTVKKTGGEEVLIPFVRQIVLDVNMEEERITVVKDWE